MKDIMVTSWNAYLGVFCLTVVTLKLTETFQSRRTVSFHQTYHGVDVLRVASSITVPRLLEYREYDSHHSKCFYHRLKHLITKPSFTFVVNEETTSEIKSTAVLSY